MARRSISAALPGVAWLAVTVVLVSCGHQPSAPAAPSPAPPPASPVDFQPGPYYLGISESGDTVPGPGGGQVFVRLCMCTGSCPTAVRVPVDVERTTGGVTLRALYGTLTGTFTLNGIWVSGTVQGWARDARDSMTGLTVQGTSAPLDGSASDRFMAGTLSDVRIVLDGPNGSGACSSSNWSVAPRENGLASHGHR